MKIAQFISFAILLLVSTRAYAFVSAGSGWPDIAADSDLICVCAVGAPSPHNDKHVATGTVIQVLRGDPKSTSVSIYVTDYPRNYVLAPELPPVGYNLLFLRHGKNAVYYSPARPDYNFDIFLGQDRPSVQVGNDLLLSVSSILLAVAENKANAQRHLAMFDLEYVEGVAWDNSAHSVWLKSALDEPTNMVETMSKSFEPQLANLRNDNDDSIRFASLRLSAALQDVTAIPSIAAVNSADHPTQSSPEAMSTVDALAMYTTPESAKMMLSLLRSTNSVEVKRAALGSLSRSLGNKSMPLLVDDLISTSDRMDTINDISLLASVSKLMPPKGNDMGRGNFTKYLGFWRNWANDHDEELKTDRADIAKLGS